MMGQGVILAQYRHGPSWSPTVNLSQLPLDSSSDPQLSDLMRMKGAAEFLGCSVATIYRAMAKKGLPARRLGACWVFSRTELAAWIKALPGINLPSAS